MKAKMSEKQIQALACLDELTAYASENRLPMRILDELEECKKQISSANVDWTAINRTMEGLFHSMEQKLTPQVIQKDPQNSEVSTEMVKEQVEKMAGRCHADNATSIDSMAERKNTIIKMNCEQLMDIAKTKAHLEDLKNEDLYLQFFQECKTRYENDSYGMFRDLLQSISENYNHTLNHMKSMFQSIDGYQNGIGNEKFYYEYEERRTGIDRRVQGEIQTADIGGNDIMSFGQKTKEKVKAIVKKLSRKRKLLAWLPFLILLAFLAIGAVGNMTQKQNETKQAEGKQNETRQAKINADNEEDENSFLEDVAKSAAKSSLENLAKKVSWKSLSSALVSLLAGLILFVLVLILIYLLYLKLIKAWFNHQVCKQCGEYLRTELFQFEQTNELSSKLDAAMESAAEEYERQYMNVLDNLFRNSQYRTEDSAQAGAKSVLDSLRAGWNRVRNL